MKTMDKLNYFFDLISYYEEIAYQRNKHLKLEGGKSMTSMQVEYSKLKETQRHNLATEAQQAKELEETHRANVVREGLSKGELEEQIRHNLAAETETYRHNNVSEQEIAAHNRASEQLMRDQNAINKYLGEINVDMQRERTVTQATTADLQRVTDAYYKGLQNEINDRLATVTENKAKQELEHLKAQTQQIWEAIGQRWTEIYQDRDYKEAMAEVSKGRLSADISQRLEDNVFKSYELDLKTTEAAINAVNNTLRSISSFIPIPQIKLSGSLDGQTSGGTTVSEVGVDRSDSWYGSYTDPTSRPGTVSARGWTN